jgi:hypothetical protein
MPNQLVSGGTITQGTTLGGEFVNQLITGTAKQLSSQACIVDLVPPVFAGIDFLTRGPLGQLRVSWLPATDTSNPIRYEVYVKPNDSINLFLPSNIVIVTTQLNADVFTIANGTLLQTGTRYYVGVRAVDAVGNRDINTVILNQTSPGITGATNAQINGVFAVNTDNKLIATFWVNDNDGVITNPARLGSATYVIYDSNGNLVPGMTQTGITPDAEGFFEITPVTSLLDLDNSYYTVKVSIPVDGMQIIYNLPITYPEAGPEYEPRAVFSINAANQLQATMWVTKNGEQLSSSLGTASFSIYDKDGNPVGISQTGLTADVNGLYKSTPVSAASLTDLTHYTALFSVTADSVVRKGAVGITIAE